MAASESHGMTRQPASDRSAIVGQLETNSGRPYGRECKNDTGITRVTLPMSGLVCE